MDFRIFYDRLILNNKGGGKEMKKECHQCGVELDVLLPFKCRHCGGLYCKDHYLPENHNCPNLPRRTLLTKNPNRPLIYPEKSNISVPVNVSERNTIHKNYYRNDRDYSSLKYSIKNLFVKTVKNKWFWTVGMPIILLIILYIAMRISYGQTMADIMIIFVFFFIVFIVILIFMPKGRKYDPLREAIYEEERIREQARQDVRQGRRRW